MGRHNKPPEIDANSSDSIYLCKSTWRYDPNYWNAFKWLSAHFHLAIYMFAVFLHWKAVYSVLPHVHAYIVDHMIMGSKWFTKAHVVAACVETIMKTKREREWMRNEECVIGAIYNSI